MQTKYLLAVALTSTLALAGCKNMSLDSMVGLGAESFKALSLTDNDVKSLSNQSCKEMDAQSKIAPPNNKYAQRLDKIAKTLGYEVDGTKVNYKVYLTPEVNAWAMANGCVRVYSGLMDKMTDNEIQGVLGHELGHVALGHSKKRMQVAYASQIALKAAAQSGNSQLAQISQSDIGDFANKLVNAQFSQSQELAADNYSFELLKKRNINPEGIASAFDKLGSGSSLLSSHPSSSKRADNIRNKIAASK